MKNLLRLIFGISSVVAQPYVKVGENFSYSVTLYNGGASRVPATDAALYSIFSGARFVSVTSSQGRCRESINSNDVVVCALGAVEPQKRVVVTVTVKAGDGSMMDTNGEMTFITSNFVRARERDYITENNQYESRGTIIRR